MRRAAVSERLQVAATYLFGRVHDRRPGGRFIRRKRDMNLALAPAGSPGADAGPRADRTFRATAENAHSSGHTALVRGL